MKLFTTTEVSEFSGISKQEIVKRCKLLNISSISHLRRNNTIYLLELEEVARVLLYTLQEFPKPKIFSYNIYESKINKDCEANTNTLAKNT